MGVQRFKVEEADDLTVNFGPTPAGYVDLYVDDDTGVPSYRDSGQVARTLKGDQGIQGIQGIQGVQGVQGTDGWEPILAVEVDSARRVLKIVDWTGGGGSKPAVPANPYLGPTGLTNLAGATDLRGATGAISYGNSVVADSVSNNAEVSTPSVTSSGASRVYTRADRGKVIRRSNGGAAMTDTLPTLTAADNGWYVKVDNLETAVAAAITFSGAAGVTFGTTATATSTVNHSCRQTFLWTGTDWRYDAGNANLLKAPTVAAVVGEFPTFTDTTGRATAGSGVKATALASAVRRFARVIDVVEDYGVDPTGATDDTSKWQAAVNAAGTGATLEVRAGRFRIDGTVTFGASHIHIRGAGRADTVLFTNSATATMFAWGASSWFSGISDLAIDNTDPVTPTQAVVTPTGTNYRIDTGSAPYAFLERLDMQRHKNCIRTAGHLFSAQDLNVREFAQYGGIGILCEGSAVANDKRLVNVTMASSTPYTAGSACIRVKQCASLRIIDCNLVGGENVLDLFPDTGQTIPSVYAIESYFDQGSTACVRFRGAGTILRSKFTSCWISGNGATTYGAFLDGTSVAGLAANGIDFIGCDFYGATVGIEAVPGTGIMNWQVIGGRVAGNTTAGIRTTAGSTHEFSVSSNSVGASGGFGNNGIGVLVQAGSYKNYQVSGNRDLNDNTTPGISDLGTAVEGKSVISNVPGPPGAAVLTASTVTAETVVASWKIPGGSLTAGQLLNLRLSGQVSSTATMTFRVRVGSAGTTADTGVAFLSPASAAGAANGYVTTDLSLAILTAGSAGTCHGFGLISVGAALVAQTAAAFAAAAINTTVQQYVTITVQQSVAQTFTPRAGSLSVVAA